MQKYKKIGIQKIAEIAHVSIGTVDRALHDRAGINPKTKKKILKIANEYHYRPNPHGRALARRNHLKIGVIALSEENPFSEKLLEGIQQGLSDYADFGLSILLHHVKQLDPVWQAQTIYELIDQKVHGLSVDVIDTPEVTQAVDEAVEAGIPVVTFNNDLLNSKRMCFVGQDAYRSGKVAADLLCRFIDGSGKVLVIHGFHKFVAHQQRLAGFQAVIQEEFEHIKIAAIEESLDDDKITYEKTLSVLEANSDIKGIYIVAAGVAGAGKAIRELGLAGQVKVVCNDLIPQTIQLIQNHVIDATIYQDPVTQGRLPLQILFEYLYEGKEPQQDIFRTNIGIYTKNLL